MDPSPILAESDLSAVIQSTAEHRVSSYVPVGRAPTELHASELRLRAAFEKAAARLRERGVAEDEVARRLAQLPDLDPLVRSLEAGVRAVAWFGDDSGWWWAPLREDVPERVVVARHFALRPLIRALRHDRRFRVLAVSTNHVTTWEGDARGLRRVAVEGVPESLVDALGSEIEARGVKYRDDQPVPGGRPPTSIYHGHAGADDERAVDRERFHRVLGKAISSAWGNDGVPVLLAAEVRAASELRKAASLPALLGEELRGNPDEITPDQLHARAWPLVRGALASRDGQLAGGYEAARNAGKALDGGFDGVAQAAVAGRVRRLWIEEQARLPGRFDLASGRRVDDGEADEDALDGLVAHVLERAGEVVVVDEGGTPAGGPFCVELR